MVVSLLSCLWFVFHGTIYFHTDIARDFLLIEDIVVNNQITLIGPHSGGIDGVFHGPAWLYLNVPAFILGKGNPIAIGWFWAFLVISSIALVYFVTKKITDTKIAMISSALYGLIISDSSANLINPFGAVLLSPLFFYFFVQYIAKHKAKDLVLAFFTLGMIIQFQMAWGVPIFFLSLPIIIHKIITQRKYLHIFSYGILAIPLSTFVLFDLRHQFLQIKSVLAYVTHTSTQARGNVFVFLGGRLQEMFLSLLNTVSFGNIFLQLYFSLVFVFTIYYIKTKKARHSPLLNYLLYFYVGYWILTLFYKGTMWGYYTTPFIPLFCIALGLLFKILPKKIMLFVFFITIVPLLYINIRNIVFRNDTFFKTNTGFWNFYSRQAQTVFNDAGSEFGWYVYTADQYGYSSKYAMHYTQRMLKTKNGLSYVKKPTTYLIIFPSTNRFTNAYDWKTNKIYLTRAPDKVFKFQGGSYVEKYILTPEEQQVPSASDLIKDLTFR
ncbi:MAG: hypothetical protein WCL18_07435 [bacterium]